MKIGNILSELLVEDYKTQTANFIRQGYNSEIVKQYIEKFKAIRDKGFKELFSDKVNIDVPTNKRNDIDSYKDFHDLEVIVDYVDGQRDVRTSLSSEEIEVDGKPVYEDDNFEIYFADTPRACIKYKGKLPYSWCVARSDSSNMFFTYRFKSYEPAFYFVKDKREFKKEFSVINVVKDIASGKFKYPYHFFVVQVSKNSQPEDNESKQYIVTSANNDGDKEMSWDEIIKLKPKLAKLKEVFKPKPFTPEERKKFEAFKNGITDKEFQKLPYREKREYLDIYPAINKPITTNQFLNLPEDLKNLYLSFGIGLNDEQFNEIKNNKNLLKRYKQISERKFEEYMKKDKWFERNQLNLSYTELLMLDDEKTKEYFNTLTDRDLKIFIRKYGHDKFDYLIKNAKYFDKILKNEPINLIRQAAFGSEEADKKISELIPESFDIYIEKDFVTIDGRGTNFKEIVEDSVKSLFERLDYRDWGSGYYDSYFESDSDGLNETYKNYIEEFIKTGYLKNEFLNNGLSYTYEVIDDLLETYHKKEACIETIETEFDSNMYESEQNAWDSIREGISKILDFKYDDEVKINTTSFIVFLYDLQLHNHDFFTTDEEAFEKNLKNLLEQILDDNDEPNNIYDVYDIINDSKYDFNVDTKLILDKISDYISDAFDDFSEENPLHDYDDYDEDPGNEQNIAKLKSQVISLFDKTLKSLGYDPNKNVIENDLVKIEFDKKRFNLNGKIYAYVTDLKNQKNYEGYMNIKDIPTYFKNYKLFEEIIKIKNMF